MDTHADLRRDPRPTVRRVTGHPVSQPASSAMMPGIVTEATLSGRWLFRWRSYLPLAVFAYVLATVDFDPVPVGGMRAIPVWSAAGILLGLAGYLFRAWTVGHVPRGTSGRGTGEPGAASLNTQGTYSMVRHPLYFGNFLMWMGVTAVAGSITALVIVALVFWIYYERIMIAEERFLYGRFGDRYRDWSSLTPAFWPRLRSWTPAPLPFSLRFALGRDYSALYGLVTATTAIEIARRVAMGLDWMPTAWWRWYFAAGTIVFLALRALKRRTRALSRTDGGEPLRGRLDAPQP